MNLSLPVPVLGADLGTLFSVVFVVIAILSWISNLLSSGGGNRPAARPAEPRRPARPPRPRDERLQDEIDIFLREVGGKRPERAPEVEPVEIVEFDEAVETAIPVAEADEAPLTKKKRPSVSTIASRSLVGPEETERGVKSHLAQPVQDRVGVEVQQHLGHAIETSVSEHFGQLSGQNLTSSADTIVPGTVAGSPVAQRLVALLKDPEGVRQAILISEILAPPLARRE